MSTFVAIDGEDFTHGLCGANGSITSDEQLKQVAEVGLEILLLNDLLDVDKNLE